MTQAVPQRLPLLSLLFGFSPRVDRRSYTVCGVVLMLVKYHVVRVVGISDTLLAAWSDAIIHRIHRRVLAHVERLSETGYRAATHWRRSSACDSVQGIIGSLCPVGSCLGSSAGGSRCSRR
jgi:hypothetical protein